MQLLPAPPQSGGEMPFDPQPPGGLVPFSVDLSHSGGCATVSFYSSTCISLVTNDVKAHFLMFIGHLGLLFYEMPIQIFCQFCNLIVCLFLIDLEEFCRYSGFQAFVGHLHCNYLLQLGLLPFYSH